MASNALESAAAPTVRAKPGAGDPARVRIEAWSFKAAFLAVFLVLVFGWGIGIPIRRVFVEGDRATLNVFALFAGAASALSFLALNARRVIEFLLSVRVGIAVLTFFLLGSIASVVVHPRNPNKFLNLPLEQRELSHRADAAWAHGFFLFSMAHPYGIGLTKHDVPPVAKEGLSRIERRYGERISRQEASGMRTALNGQLRGEEVKEFIARHQRALDGFYEAARFLQLNGTPTGMGAWSSDWFAAAMVLLFVLVLTNTFRRGFARAVATGPPGMGFLRKLPDGLAWDVKSLVSLPRIGFLCTHLGVMTALTGALVSRMTEERGILQLSTDPVREGWPQRRTQFQTYSGEIRDLVAGGQPFGVELADFRADYRDVLEVAFVKDPPPPQSMIPRYRWFEAWTGRQIALDYDEEKKPTVTVRVKDHYPRANVEFQLSERPPDQAPENEIEASGAIAEMSVRLPDGRGFMRRLLAGHAHYSIWDDIPGTRIRLESAADAAEQTARLAAPFEGGPVGTLEAWIDKDSRKPAATAFIEPGAVLELTTPEGPAKVHVLQSLPDARLMPLPTGEVVPQFATMQPETLPPLHPGVRLRIEGPRGAIPSTWVHEKPEDSPFKEGNVVPIGGATVFFRVTWDHWASPARERYRIVLAPGLPARIARVGATASTELAPGQRYDIGRGLAIVLEQRADRPRFTARIQPIPGDADDDAVFFDEEHPGAARVEVDGPEGKKEFLLAAGVEGASSAVYGGRIGLDLFLDTRDLPREWKSKLKMLEWDATRGWHEAAAGTIRVNDYFKYRGWRFFQTDANAQFPGYSGVGVVYDPGIGTVLVGMWMVIAGVAYVFFIKPFLVRRTAA